MLHERAGGRRHGPPREVDRGRPRLQGDPPGDLAFKVIHLVKRGPDDTGEGPPKPSVDA